MGNSSQFIQKGVADADQIKKEFDLEQIKNSASDAIKQLFRIANPKRGDIVIIGCSTSEVIGHKIGSYSSINVAEALFNGIHPVCEKAGVYLAAQCCEHLNRAIIIERSATIKYSFEQVNVIPQPKAGGAFATICYSHFKNATAVEEVEANCGIDIGGTLIGMHLKAVAVPVRLEVKTIGCAPIICARTRPKFVGGVRAVYDDMLL